MASVAALSTIRLPTSASQSLLTMPKNAGWLSPTTKREIVAAKPPIRASSASQASQLFLPAGKRRSAMSSNSPLPAITTSGAIRPQSAALGVYVNGIRHLDYSEAHTTAAEWYPAEQWYAYSS